MQIPEGYGSTGAGGQYCPTSWRNKFFQTDIGGYQTQLEEAQTGPCPPPGTFTRIELGPDNGPDEIVGSGYAFSPNTYLSSCKDAPCRLEYCIEGDLDGGTSITQKARIHSIQDGFTRTASTPGGSDYGGGLADQFYIGIDRFHSGPGDADMNFVMQGTWTDVNDHWIGCAPEVEGVGCGEGE